VGREGVKNGEIEGGEARCGTCAAATCSQRRQHFRQADRLRNGGALCHGRNLDRIHSETSTHAHVPWALLYPEQEACLGAAQQAAHGCLGDTRDTLAWQITLQMGARP